MTDDMTAMEFRFMGTTGLKVSALCLGAMTFGRESDEKTSYALMDRFLEAGGNFIDTADAYSGADFVHGDSEEILGRWLAGQDRERLVIATKVRWRTGPGANDEGLTRKHILANVERSLRRLGTDYVDLYQVHGWDGRSRLDETLRTLDELVTSGKVRYLGASNYSGWQLQKAIDRSRQHGWEPFTCLQPLYNLLDREAEWELLEVAREEGLGVIPWSPLRGGWLAGKYRRGMSGPLAGTRIEEAGHRGGSEAWEAYDREETWSVLDAVQEIANEIGRSPAQVALNWLLRRPGITAPILGARRLDQLEDNLGAVGWSLTDQQVARLTKISEQRVPYPYQIVNQLRS